ncbi:MFS transporter, partial [Pseudoalteromonas sp. S186]
LLGLLASEFGVSTATAGSLNTATILHLAIEPLVYGLCLDKQKHLKILSIAKIVLCFCGLLFIWVPSIELILLSRVLQGLTL